MPMHKATAKRKVLLHDGKSSLSRDNTRRNHKINTTVPSRKHHAITQSSCSNSNKHHHAPGRKPCMRAEKEQESCTALSHAMNPHRITEGPKHRYKIRKKQNESPNYLDSDVGSQKKVRLNESPKLRTRPIGFEQLALKRLH